MKIPFHAYLIPLLCVGPFLAAETLVLNPVADATIHQESENANGGGQLITGHTAGKSGKGFRRALIRFDLSTVPAGAQIESAELGLVFDKSGVAATFTGSRLHRLTRSWGEGTSNPNSGEGDSPETGEVTFGYAFYDSEAWNTPGGDFLPAVSGSSSGPITEGRLHYSGTGMVADVKHWLDNPAENFGWIINTNEDGIATTLHFFSREASANLRPELTITYTPSLANLYGGYPIDEANDIETGRLLGRLNLADAPQLWSYLFENFLLMPEIWIQEGGAWAYFLAELDLGAIAPADPTQLFGGTADPLGDLNTGDAFLGWVNTSFKPWIYVYATGNWAYIEETFADGFGVYIYFLK
jgi:hypothetical protein